MKSTRKFSKVLSLALALVLALALFPTAVFAADEITSITVSAPNGIEAGQMKDATVNAYQMLAKDVTDTSMYVPTADWADFFGTIQTNPAIITNEMKYLSFDGSKLFLSNTDNGSSIELEMTYGLNQAYPVYELLGLIVNKGQVAQETFAAWATAYAKSLTATATATFDGTTTSVTLPDAGTALDPGYYLTTVTKLPATVVSHNSILQIMESETINITLKGQSYPITKEANTETAQAGDTVTYTITLPIPQTSLGKSVANAIITDTVRNLLIDLDSFRLQIGDTIYGPTATTGVTAWTSYIDMDASHLVDDDTTFTIDFNADGDALLTAAAANGNINVVLTYEAVMTDDAVLVNGNDVDFDFDHGPYHYSGEDTADVYTYGIQLNKTFEGLTDTALAAARADVRFLLYDSTDTLVPLVGSDGVYYYTNETATVNTNDAPLMLATDGTIKIYGLDADTAVDGNGTIYKLVETATEDGFGTATVTITLFANATTGELNTDACTVTISNGTTWDNGYVDSDPSDEGVLNLAVDVDLLNRTDSFTLPSTGGAGTWMFTLGGLALIAIAGTALYVSKKKVTE